MNKMVEHTVMHFEIPANNIKKLSKFYSELFGWQIEKVPSMEYWLILTVPIDEEGVPLRPGINGAMIKRQKQEQKITNYISVENLRDYLQKIERLGGKIISNIQEVPNIGIYAYISDPEGNIFALWQKI